MSRQIELFGHGMSISSLGFWIPRIMAILFILFLSVFALDMIEPGKPISTILLGITIHLLPNILLSLILWYAWHNERSGGILFIVLSILFMIFFHTYDNIFSFLLITCPLFIIGALFLLHATYYPISKSTS